MADYAAATGHTLPWNLAGPTWGGFRTVEIPSREYPAGYTERKLPKAVSIQRMDEIVEEFARFAGWIRAAAALPALPVAFKFSMDWGMGCGGTNLWEVFRRFPSPGRLNRLIFATAEKAARVLTPYGISRVHFSTVLTALMNHSPRKAWKHAAEAVLRECTGGLGNQLETFQRARGYAVWVNQSRQVKAWAIERVMEGEFACLRDAIAQANRLAIDTTDGVELLVDPAQAVVIHGVTAVPGWTDDKYCQQYFVLSQGGTRRTFHSYYRTAKEAVKEAIAAWHQQVKHERAERARALARDAAEKEFLASLQPEHFSVLVFPTDSRPHNAGNCESGTAAWMDRNGFRGRWYVRVTELLPFRGEQRVRNILNVVATAVKAL